MAKGNMFLGQAKGKVGSVVFSRAFGQQITRTKPSSVKNPKTHAQNAQRAILASVAKAASIMTPIVDHSFAGVAYGAESVRHFRKINLNQLRALYMDGDPTGYNLTPKGGSVVPNSYIVSQGNLPAFQIAYYQDTYGFKMSDTAIASDSVSVEDFLKAYPYLQGGDQLTLVQLVLTSGSLETGDARFAFVYDRIIFASNAFDNPSDLIINGEGYFNTAKLDLTKTTNPNMLMSSEIGSQGMLVSERANVYAAALILSREVNGQWQRSTQEMGLTHDSDIQDIESAIASYGATASESTDEEYLNQADDNDSVQEGVSGAYANAIVMVNGVEQESKTCLANEIKTISTAVPASANFSVQIVGFGTSSARLVTCDITGPDNTLLEHGTPSARYSANWQATLAGVYKLIAVFADGTRSEFDITLSQQA